MAMFDQIEVKGKAAQKQPVLAIASSEDAVGRTAMIFEWLQAALLPVSIANSAVV